MSIRSAHEEQTVDGWFPKRRCSTVAMIEAEEDIAGALVALVARSGSGAHGYTHSFELNAAPVAQRNMADTLRFLSILHCAPPGLIECAAARNILTRGTAWFAAAAAGFAEERTFLGRLIVQAGPVPSTPADTEASTAMHARRHALDMMAVSERVGCALGAAAALLLDWRFVRAVLDAAAERIGVPVPAMTLPEEGSTLEILARLPATPVMARSLMFGARQLLLQHHGMWDLLEARAGARAALSGG